MVDGTVEVISEGNWKLLQSDISANEGATVKLLLTSAGIKNPSIENALVELLGKPIAEADALCIPTASYGTPDPA